MKRVALGLVGLLLAGCQQTLVTPEPLPELRESALGQTLALSGQVENWPAGLVANIALNPYAEQPTVIGSVSGAGVFNVSTTAKPGPLYGAVDALLAPVPIAAQIDRCSSGELKVSDPAAQGYGFQTLALKQSAGSPQNLRPQLTPPLPVPELVRRDAQNTVKIFYVDRDVRIEGSQVCSGRNWASQGRWQQASSVNLQLREGWNIITVKIEYLGPQGGQTPSVYPYRLTVQGGDMLAGTSWKYNGVSLNR